MSFLENEINESKSSTQCNPCSEIEFLAIDGPSRGNALGFLDRYIAALNTRDPGQIIELYRPRSTLVTASRTVFGRKKIKTWFENLFSQLPAEANFIKTSQNGDGNIRSMGWIAQGQKQRVFDPGLFKVARGGLWAGATQIFQGVSYKKLARTKPRVHTAFLLSVNLSDPDIDLMVTPPESLGITTSDFLIHHGLQMAVNGDEWISWRNPKGLAVSRGVQYSAPSFEPSVYISASNQVQVGGPPPAIIWDAISGSHTLVRNGEVNRKLSTCAKPEVYCKNLAPRSSLGLTQDNKLILIVAQGLQDSLRDALTLKELASLNVELGVQNAISLDGGGSSTMTINDQGNPIVVNSPSDGKERVVSNHLGIRAALAKELIIENGNDSFGLMEEEIVYHFTSFRFRHSPLLDRTKVT